MNGIIKEDDCNDIFTTNKVSHIIVTQNTNKLHVGML